MSRIVLDKFFSFGGDAFTSLLSEPDGQMVFDSLARSDTLQEVSLINTSSDPDCFDIRLPPFRNLYRLELLGMHQGRDGRHERDREVAKILITCPDIRVLALSTAGWAEQDDIALLPKLVQHYRTETSQRLRLRSLRLGYGFLPVRSPSDYLSELTDTTLLETLRLDNDNVNITTIVTDAPIDVEQFASAINITSLTAERLSADIVALIHQLSSSGQLTTLSLPRYCDTQPRARMDEENDHWWDDWYGPDGLAEPPQWEPNQTFSEQLEQAGKHWKSLLIGDIFRTEYLDDGILDCIATYTHFEILTLPLHAHQWPRFRDGIMPRLPYLQELFLVGGKMAGTHGYPGFAVSDDEMYSSKMPELEREKLIKQRDEEYTAHLTTFATTVFRENRSKIARGEVYAELRYLGLGSFVYTCLLLPARASCEMAAFSVEKDGESRKYQVVLLDEDGANVFGSMREYNEEIEELRVGGDERGPAW